MKFAGLRNQKICSGEYQPLVALVKNCKNRTTRTGKAVSIFSFFSELERWWQLNEKVVGVSLDWTYSAKLAKLSNK